MSIDLHDEKTKFRCQENSLIDFLCHAKGIKHHHSVGDVVSGLSSVVAAGYLDIQPGAGIEWVIHNIYHESDVQLEFYDGTNSLIFDTDTGAGVYAKYAFHMNNTRRIRVKNTAATAKLIGYDGVQSK